MRVGGKNGNGRVFTVISKNSTSARLVTPSGDGKKPYFKLTIMDDTTHRCYNIRIYRKSYTPTSDQSRAKGVESLPCFVTVSTVTGGGSGSGI